MTTVTSFFLHSAEITDSCCNNALSSDNKVEAKIQATALRVGDCKVSSGLVGWSTG